MIKNEYPQRFRYIELKEENKITEGLLNLYRGYHKLFDSIDNALWNLFETYKDNLPLFDPEYPEQFQKMFRQTDVTDNGKVDMAIWWLINGSDLFEECISEYTKELIK